MSYIAPLKDMQFVIEHLAGLDKVLNLPPFLDAELDEDTISAILEECSKFAQEIIAPLNWTGDLEASTFVNGEVSTATGFKEAFTQYALGGWQGVIHHPEYGGQGLPRLLNAACYEMINAANISFALCPLLTDGAIDALIVAASPELKERYIPKMISGEWTGTMNLTEPQAGSDLSLVRTKAEPRKDGSYHLFGTKIYITYGEHDFTKNIVHLVLARTPNAPEGVKGISLFVVPKFLVQEDGSLGNRNDVHCISIEHKLGIKASPTAVLQFGDHGGAVGYLVGEENRGLEYMFIMMNSARFGVGMQGIAISDRAYQKAVSYAKERLQSRDLDGSPGAVSIIHHPDIRRMLLTMRAKTEGARALAYVAAAARDTSDHALDANTRQSQQAFYEFMVPIIKGFSTEMSVEIASLGVQVHGGMGFIEETGAAQFYRDARILPIYEGTTAIQANDLVGRKTLRDGGAVARSIAAAIQATEADLRSSGTDAALAILPRLTEAREHFELVVQFITQQVKSQTKSVFAGSVPYLMLCGMTFGGWQMARSLLIAQTLQAEDPSFYTAKIHTAQFYAVHILPQVASHAFSILNGGQSVNAMPEEQF